MTDPNRPAPGQQPHQRRIHSTVGEINEWFAHEGAPGSTRAGLYLNYLNGLRANASLEVRLPLNTLAHEIINATEDRLADQAGARGGHLPEDIPGVTPLREVTEVDIAKAVSRYDPDSPDFDDRIAGADEVYGLHRVINHYVMREMGIHSTDQN